MLRRMPASCLRSCTDEAWCDVRHTEVFQKCKRPTCSQTDRQTGDWLLPCRRQRPDPSGLSLLGTTCQDRPLAASQADPVYRGRERKRMALILGVGFAKWANRFRLHQTKIYLSEKLPHTTYIAHCPQRISSICCFAEVCPPAGQWLGVPGKGQRGGVNQARNGDDGAASSVCSLIFGSDLRVSSRKYDHRPQSVKRCYAATAVLMCKSSVGLVSAWF